MLGLNPELLRLSETLTTYTDLTYPLKFDENCEYLCLGVLWQLDVTQRKDFRQKLCLVRAEEREACGADPTGGGEARGQAGHARTHARTVRAADRYRACQVRTFKSSSKE
jgi:hypothetical protein